MRKRVSYSEIVFTDKFYINGVDVFDENNVEFLGYVDIDLQYNLSYAKIDNAKLYLIKDLDTQIAIAQMEDFRIVCYLKHMSFVRLAKHPKHQESLYYNFKMLEEFAILKIKNLNEDNCVYSADYKTRAVITPKDNVFAVKYQILDVEDLEFNHFYENISSNNFWQWETLDGTSYFDSVETAKKEAEIVLRTHHSPSQPARLDCLTPIKTLWQFQLSRVQTWFYMMKFALLTTVVWMLLWCLFPLSGESNWNVLYLAGGSALLGLIVGGIVLWQTYDPITYIITEKGIHSIKGDLYETTFDNIKKVKIRRNLFDKNKGSIKFKLRKGLALNYNFDNIEYVDDAYKILVQQMEAFIQQNSN